MFASTIHRNYKRLGWKASQLLTKQQIHRPPPIDSLPDDILIQIFSLYIEPWPFINTAKYWHIDRTFRTSGVKDNPRGPRHNDTPILLGHVSSRWRAVAQARPCLWSSIRIYNRNCTDDAKLLDLYLSHSQSTLLDIYLVHPPQDIQRCPQDHGRSVVLDRIFTEAPRLRILELRDVSLEHAMLSLLRKYQADAAFPNLESVHLSAANPKSCRATLIRQFTQAICTSPVLKEMDIRATGCDSLTWIPDFSRRQLTVVRWSASASASEFLMAIEACSGILEECWIDGILQDGPTPRTITFPKLHTLFIRIEYDAPYILSGLKLPALKHFGTGNTAEYWTANAIIPDPTVLWELLTPLIRRSGCHLESLDIECIWEDRMENTREFLRSVEVETLTSVRVKCYRLSEDACSVLVPWRDESPLWLPRLTSLSLAVRSHPSIDAMVRRRERESPGLNFIMKVLDPPPPTRFRRMMNTFRVKS